MVMFYGYVWRVIRRLLTDKTSWFFKPGLALY